MKAKAVSFWIKLLLLFLLFSSCQKENSVKTSSLNAENIKEISNSLLSTHIPNKQISAPIFLSNVKNKTIQNLYIQGKSQVCLKLINCSNIYITANEFCNSSDVGIELINCSNITIEKNYIHNVSSGIYAVDCPNGSIMIFTNQMKNMQGPFPRGQFVQFNNVNGPQNRISYNNFQNYLGYSNPEDAINLYKSNGVVNDPIQISYNNIRGGGPSKSGGGIMLGDNGGSYQTADHNVLVDPGQYGMAIAGGSNISITDNSIYAALQSFTNVGMYIWGQSGTPCINTIVRNNRVKFLNSLSIENDSWIASGESIPTGWSTNIWNAQLSEELLPQILVK